MPYRPPDQFEDMTLTQIAQYITDDTLPPVDEWRPKHIVDSRMHIDKEQRWFHEGTSIKRPAMIRAFARLLRRDNQHRGDEERGYALITPHTAYTITVEDAPFAAIELESRGKNKERTLIFRLNIDRLIIAGTHHRLIFPNDDFAPPPYLLLDHGLSARINRNVWNQLANLILLEAHNPPGLYSQSAFFPFANIL